MQVNKINHLAAECKFRPAASPWTHTATVEMEMDVDLLPKSS